MDYQVMRQGGYDSLRSGIVDGARAEFITMEAGVGGINPFSMVMVATDGTLRTANASETSHAGKLVGMSTAAALEGEDCLVQKSGEIVNPNWDLDPGVNYFAGRGGAITINPPVPGFWQRVGIGKDSVTLILSLSEPVVR